MENQSSFFPILYSFLIFIFLVLRIWKKSKSSNSNLPPGPWKLPVIGNLHLLAGSLPHRRLRDLAKKHGPLMHLQLGELTGIVISSPEMAKEVMKTHDISFCQRPHCVATKAICYNCGDIAFAPYGEYWRQMRKICTLELLSAKRVQSFRSIREEEVSKMIRSVSSKAGSPINVGRTVSSATYNIISRAAFGKIFKGEDTFLSTLNELIVATGGFSLSDTYPSIKLLHWLAGFTPRVERNMKVMDKMIQNIIDEHRTKRAVKKSSDDECEEEDFVDVLLNVQEGRDFDIRLTDDNIKAAMLDIFSAGSETSATPVEWAMSELLKNPRVLAKAQEEVRRVFDTEGNVDESRLNELNYLNMVVKETLRLHPPFPLLLPRECRESCVINGYDIPYKSKVIVNVWAIGRDPNHWKEADKFYPERFQDCSIDYKGKDFELLPFGAGRRICPGMSFGIMNVEFPLAQLLYHFDWKLPTGVKPETLDMNEVFGAVVKRKTDLQLVPIPYLPQLVR